MLGKGATAFDGQIEYPGGDRLGAVCRIRLDVSLLDGDALNVSVVQLALPGRGLDELKTVLTEDGPRPVAVRALGALLAGEEGEHGPRLAAFAQARSPAVVVLPELALGSGDWPQVDRFVREYPGTLIVLAGAGFVRGDVLHSWAFAEEQGGTQRVVAIEENEQLLAEHRLNIGYCWIRVPGRATRCIAIVKNFAEQRHEFSWVQDLYTSSTLLRLDANDVTLFPTVCADLICEGQGGKAPRARIERSLAAEGAAGGRSLVVGMLLQLEPANQQWRNRLSRFVAGEHRVVICNALSSPPSGPCAPREEDDRWRNLTGVYAPRGVATPAGRDALRAIVADDLGLFGVVLRETTPCVLGGALRWGVFNPQAGRYFWDAGMVARIDPDGRVAPARPITRVSAEAARLVRRWLHTWRTRLASPWNEAAVAWADEVAGWADERAERLLRMALHGPVEDAKAAIDVDGLEKLTTDGQHPANAVGTVLWAIAAVREALELDFEARPGVQGQLAGLDGTRNVLVWSDQRRNRAEMERVLFDWLDEPAGGHPDLVVFAKAAYAEPPLGPIHTRRRRNISEPTPRRERRIDDGARGRRAWAVRLDALVSACLRGEEHGTAQIAALTREAIRDGHDDN